MRVYILIFIALLCASCAGNQPVNNAANEKIKERNKLTVAKNEAGEITRVAQKLEQNGRDMQAYRDSPGGAESARQCNEIFEARRKESAELEARVNNLPDNYKTKLTPIISELNECISCEKKKSLDDCKRARASINQVIKELYP